MSVALCVVQVDANTLRPTASLACSPAVDDELAVGRSTYVLTASVAATSAEVERAAIEPIETETDKIEAVVHVVSPVKKTVAHPVTVEAEVQESLSEVATGSTTVHDAVKVVAVVEDEVVDVIAATEKKPASIDDVAHEGCAVALEEMDAEAAASDVLAPALGDKVLGNNEDVIAEPKNHFTRKAFVPEDSGNSVEAAKGNGEAAHVVEHGNAASMKKTIEVVEAAEASSTMKMIAAIPATGDKFQTETQSEISETPAIEKVNIAAATKGNEVSESEIDETMVIDPDVVAKEAVAQTSSFCFIPEPIRNNSYAVSSVALAVATAITAALLARR
ncbi:hypothetical protein KXD40_002703 [Peronospora effusa]|uniref:Uncharacterized protein n=1 Tax=Peronospora effusa TaxID=542832 RepID=A0A3M6VT54_9STRA|nr:hypothetical protein DD238_002748 [Peronospora effusa]UIZ29474.1 hypothetical protein KXD40_002703 [Peronospora effusa]